MSKFVLDVSAIESISGDINSCSADLESVLSNVSSYDVSDSLEFNFEGAKGAIVSNLNESLNKIENTKGFIDKVVSEHTAVQNQFKFDAEAIISVSSKSDYGTENKAVNETSDSMGDNGSENSNEDYTVAYGDTLFNLAKKYNTSVAALAAVNGITDVNLIHVGQKLIIPNGNEQAVSQASSQNNVDSKDNSEIINKDGVSNSKIAGEVFKAEFTAYYPSDDPIEGGFQDCKGNPLNPENLTCAAPSNIPYGTKIKIDGTGTSYDGKIFTVTDRGGAIKIKDDGTYRIDILMSNNSECNDFGRRGGKITVLK